MKDLATEQAFAKIVDWTHNVLVNIDPAILRGDPNHWAEWQVFRAASDLAWAVRRWDNDGANWTDQETLPLPTGAVPMTARAAEAIVDLMMADHELRGGDAA